MHRRGAGTRVIVPKSTYHLTKAVWEAEEEEQEQE
jgi:hypothetical protein